MKSGMRAAIVVVAICSWFAISNHCGFAALATKTRLHRVPVSFQACEARKAVDWSAVLQNFARRCFGRDKELDSRRREILRGRSLL